MAGYPSRTPGELGRLTDRVDRMEGMLRQVLSPTGEQYAQAVAGLREVVDDLSGAVGDIATLTQNLAKTVAAIPVMSANGDVENNIGARGTAATFYEHVRFSVPVPDGKTTVSGQVIGNAVMVDMTSGGFAYITMRIVITSPRGTVTSPTFQAAKNSGASAVNNVVTGAAIVSQSGLKGGDSVIVSIQVAASNPAAFPNATGNLVQGSMLASFGS